MPEPRPVWIDPPEGWRYGFPRLWNGQGNARDWVHAHGYPDDTQSWRQYWRMWEPSEQEIEQFLQRDNP